MQINADITTTGCEWLQREGREVCFLCKCSFLEIYKEVITDLLNPAATRLQIREDFKRGIHVEGLVEEVVTSGTLTLCAQAACQQQPWLHHCLRSQGMMC